MDFEITCKQAELIWPTRVGWFDNSWTARGNVCRLVFFPYQERRKVFKSTGANIATLIMNT